MKKVLATLTILALTVAAIFAASGDTLQITAKIAKKAPSFQMYGSFDTAYNTVAGTTNNTLTTTDDISEENITVNVKLVQNTVAKYNESFDITIEATNLKNGNNEASVTCSTATSAVSNNANLTVAATKANAKATYTMTYTNGKPVAANTIIGYATFVWTANENLAAGDYSASITLSYSAS